MNIYLAMKHTHHPYMRGAHTEAGTVEKAFTKKKDAKVFVEDKNKRSVYYFWSVKTKTVIA